MALNQENTVHFLLCCESHKIGRSKLLKNAHNQDQTLGNYDDDQLIYALI